MKWRATQSRESASLMPACLLVRCRWRHRPALDQRHRRTARPPVAPNPFKACLETAPDRCKDGPNLRSGDASQFDLGAPIPRGVLLSGSSPGVHVYEAVGGRALGVVAEPTQRACAGPIVLESEFEIERNGVWGVPRRRNKVPRPPLQFERDTWQRMNHGNSKRHHGRYGRLPLRSTRHWL